MKAGWLNCPVEGLSLAVRGGLLARLSSSAVSRTAQVDKLMRFSSACGGLGTLLEPEAELGFPRLLPLLVDGRSPGSSKGGDG